MASAFAPLPYQTVYGSMGTPMSTSWGSGVAESKHLGNWPGPKSIHIGQPGRKHHFTLDGLHNHSPGAVRAYSTESSTFGSGRRYDEYPPAHLASSASLPSLPNSSLMSARQPFGGSHSSFGSSFGLATLSASGRAKIRPNLGDSIFFDDPTPPPPPPGDGPGAMFQRYRAAQLNQKDAFQRRF